MPKYLINKELIIQTAMAITDEQGLENLTLKEMSQRLNVSSPALYKHFKNLEEIKIMVSNQALELVKNEIVRSVIGKSGIEALQAMGIAYIRFAREHKGLYETIQWMNLNVDVPKGSLFYEVIQLVYQVSQDLGANELEASHIIRTVRSIAQGFADVDSHNGFSHESSVESSIEYAYETFFLGVAARLKESQPE
ncbi:AcrR family transcriptional regulator [Enterococcus sp. PF1-24]|uniref:TetR/AcrR family transcriptional regulator n=1 Tax=unclassified Enterococcus TaxID=2608891 RepID=UPI0024744948|nr:MULTISPECIES: TetR/AcrR family transcriptional regulator [unclassified Enterococcus]MDH6364669.1 AcrR family transcriptional regulator [Enterococcus sp. PFB1-1]MDH6401770.1 AcrR family transcriptional regulator [Enterococcus sp. PF1-24]